MGKARYLAHVHLLALFLAVAAVAAPARAQPATGPLVNVITDSVGGVLMYDSTSTAILRQGFDLDIEPVICRKLAKPGCLDTVPPPPSAIDTVQALAGQGRLGKIVVVDAGYNDTPDEVSEAIDPLMRALVAGGVEKVIWVTYVERVSEWVDSNRIVVEAAARWPQLVVADWNAVALTHPEWFVDEAHLNSFGGRALAAFLHPFLVYACGAACVPQPVFCGLARTSAGFDYVQATAIGCAAARGSLAGIDRGSRGTWSCVENVDPDLERTCSSGDERIEVLARSPVAPARVNGVVTIANWSFRLQGAVLEARQNARNWLSLGRAPWCPPAVPQEALEALGRHADRDGCFR
jgi:hypothetical protein